MGYNRLGSPESAPNQVGHPRRRRLILLSISATFLLLVSALSIAAFVHTKSSASTGGHGHALHKPSIAISETCSNTRFPSLCINSLVNLPGAKTAGQKDLVHLSVNMTLQHITTAIYGASSVANLHMDTLLRSAYDDCMELMEDSMDHLSRSLAVVAPSPSAATQRGSDDDVLTWLSSALTNQDTCMEGFDGVAGGYIKDQMVTRVKQLTELVSNCLAIFAAASQNKDFAGIPIHNRRRLMGAAEGGGGDDGFPEWVWGKERRLLQLPVTTIKADFVVSKDGNGTHKTIEQAVKAAPDYSPRRIIIYIKAGRYDENIKVRRKKTNLMFIGDGKSNTIIAGSRSVTDNITTFHTATFAATGAGFIARDITFQNWAGPSKHQAVALRVGADHAVVYRCNIIGYQDTLYVHSQRQFFRECDIYGTVDFIFGNAAVVLQNCSLYARKPLDMQKNTITAQNRKDPNQNTGISIHACRILPTSDLAPVKGNFPTYLGRPWKLYSRTVYMMSYISDHVHPSGWLEWNATFALDTLYYGEYMNFGPGAAVGKRVTWPGYRVINLPEEASKFTVAQFITGATWLPSTGVSFLAGLSV